MRNNLYFLRSQKSPLKCNGVLHYVQSKAAFTFLEIILVLIVMGILALSGMRMWRTVTSPNRYQETVEELRTIARAIVGDERLLNLGVRADFGYFGRFASFPAAEGGVGGTIVPTGALVDYLPPQPYCSSVPNTFRFDPWGQLYEYSLTTAGTGENIVQIVCYGEDRHRDGNDDVVLSVYRDLYSINRVDMNIMDSNGTILRGPVAPWVHQIYIVEFIHPSGSFGTIADGTITYSRGLFSISSIPAGFYRVRVYPTQNLGGGAGGTIDHRDNLCSGNNFMQEMMVVYPKGLPGVSRYNLLEFRFPGEVDPDEIRWYG